MNRLHATFTTLRRSVPFSLTITQICGGPKAGYLIACVKACS
jgi:hypothetical protein